MSPFYPDVEALPITSPAQNPEDASIWGWRYSKVLLLRSNFGDRLRFLAIMVRLCHFVAGGLLMALAAAVSSAQIPGWSAPESVAKVVSLTGQVSMVKDTQPWALHVGSVIQLKQLIVTGDDGFAVFQVSDGSTFEVYPNSRVTFRNNPSNWKDLLDVWLGRVKVHIEKLGGGRPNHNRITTPTAIISVRGTTFDVQVEEEDTTLVAVEEGQVAVQHALLPVAEPKILNSGEYIRVYKNQPLAQKGSDKSGIMHQALNAATEALYRIIYRPSSGAGGPTAGGGTGPSVPGGRTGDTTTAPPPPPPPPPPPAQGPTAPPPGA